MACRFEYQGKSYSSDELVDVLRNMDPREAAPFIPGVNPLPPMPMSKTWHELALKRALREAAEKGYDRLSWTPGEAQAARYSLAKHFDELRYEPSTQTLDGFKDGQRILSKDVAPKDLPDNVGKETAKKLLDAPLEKGRTGTERHRLTGLDLKVGGEGMRGFYDQITPKAIEKIAKEHGVKVQKGGLPGKWEAVDGNGHVIADWPANNRAGAEQWLARINENRVDAPIKLREAQEPVWYIDIPQSLREQAQRKGFALFEDSAMFGAPLSAMRWDPLTDPNYKIQAIKKKGQGIPVGKSAKGWDFKRADPKKGTWERAVAETRAAWANDKSRILNDYLEQTNSRMTPDDWAFMQSDEFRADGGRVNMADGGTPQFDPTKPFEAVEPTFDPNQPFEAVESKPDAGALNAAGRGAYQGVTFGFGDELRGLGEAGGVKPDEWNNPIAMARGAIRYWGGDKDAEKTYDTATKRERAADKLAAEQHPYAYHGGEFAGALPSMAALPGGMAARGATLAARMRQGALVGTEYGLLSGAGEGTDAASRITGSGVGAVAGGVGGAAAAPVAEGAGYVLKRALGPAWNAVTGMFRGSEAEAARRLFTAAEADSADIAAGKMAGMTPQQWLAAKAAGEPVMLADFGGTRVQSLLRSAANTSPEARGTLEKAINDRFEGQAERVAQDVRNLVSGGANAHKTADQLVAEYDVARIPAYRKAFSRPGAQSMWDDDFAQMANAPVVQQAIRMASVNAKNEAAKLGLKPPVNPFQFNKDGTVALSNPNFVPNLQFWDVVKKNLDKMGADGNAWSKVLRGKLDDAVPEYGEARGIAANFFGERDALDAGRKLAGKNVDPQVVAGLMRKMDPAEKDLFREGFASDWAGRVIGGFRDSRDITKAMFNSPNEREMARIVFGDAGIRKLQARMTLEAVMDGARRAMGNSTTARQLIEAGLAGGALAGYSSGWDPRTMLEGAGAAAGTRKFLATEMAAGARHLIGKVDAKTAARVADLLTSDDPGKLAQGLRIMVSNQRVASGMRALADRLANAGQEKGIPRLTIDTTGWGGSLPARADQDQQQPPRLGNQ